MKLAQTFLDIGAMVMLLMGGTALAAETQTFPHAPFDPPNTSTVLGKLHHANQEEIEMGKMAEKDGHSAGVKKFGKTLVSDHMAADKKVMSLAKQEKIDLDAATPATKPDDMPSGSDFDAKFSKTMLDNHKKDIAEATAARDGTTDDKLRKLLGDILPTLKKHESIAQKLVDDTK